MQKLIAGLAVLVGVLVAFYGGAKYGSSHSTAAAASTGSSSDTTGRASAGASPGTRAGAGGGFVAPAAAGQIVATANGTITVHDRTTNKDLKVNLGSARISKTVPGTAADLTQSTNVTVVGQTAPDGSVNAQAISIGGGLGAGGRVRPSPST
jgi:hypothetical protein